MDRMLYVAMSGAKQNMLAQAHNANNMANVSTIGFKSDLAAARSMPLFGNAGGFPTRVFSMTERAGTDFNSGAIQTTGRALDIAIKGQGFIAVQGRDGNEAYTRAGELNVSANGLLETSSGLVVLGDGGPITLPPAKRIEISADGSISIINETKGAEVVSVIERIKLVNPDLNTVRKGNDGLFHIDGNEVAEASADVELLSGVLEGSNVNIATELVNMIELARQFEMQVKMMKTAEENDEYAMRLINIA